MQYKDLEKLMPIRMKIAKGSNYKFVCIMLYVIQNGSKVDGITEKNIKNDTQFLST